MRNGAAFREAKIRVMSGLPLPHVLGREPYGASTKPTESFNFEEDVDGTDHKKYLWSNAAYALGTRLTEAFSMHGWCVAIRGVEGGGLVQGLPTHTFETDEGEVAMKCPTEVAITDRAKKEFSDNGFIPLVHCKGTDYAAFFATQSANKAKKYDTDDANANARLVVATAIHFRRFAFRPLSKINGARQNRLVYVQKRSRALPE
jgi:type VI secretion system protein ImpC